MWPIAMATGTEWTREGEEVREEEEKRNVKRREYTEVKGRD